MRAHLLPRSPNLAEDTLRQISNDHDRFATNGLPDDLDEYLKNTYRLDMAASYAGIRLRNPWGKASGQLSMNQSSVLEAADAGLGLVVLKTVIAKDAAGAQAMSAWAIKESQMAIERIRGTETPDLGWTVTWIGRGWWQTFDKYLDLVAPPARSGRHARFWSCRP